ncbi:DUF4345 family protein [Mycolicibacter arupensis]|uniref:DUF4345 domain-containing protein n=1 Tax=Mycolicibacter arupensis TaxID=342002 RepID=A0A5C7XZJ6_9MYCO|nr:DUF4345 family protein [Mycolicibacter arupensis]TXI54696.1 MAG: DUF4345 domain-containing protein [Mycolicibacter arupensis]
MYDLGLYLGALLFAVMGVGALVVPDRVTEQFDVPTLTIAGRNEVRAVYGGFGIAMAAMLIVASTSMDLRLGVGLTIGVALIGMAVGRLVSAVIDRSLPSRPLMYLVVELVAAGVILYGASGG